MPVKNFAVAESLSSELIENYGQYLPAVGTILPFAGQITQSSAGGAITTTAPSGWLLCNGNSFLYANYPLLYAVLNTTSLPLITGRYPVGFTSGDITPYAGTNVHVHNILAGNFTTSSNATDLTHGHNLTMNNQPQQSGWYHDHGAYVNGASNNGAGSVNRGNGTAGANVVWIQHVHYGGGASYTNAGNATHGHNVTAAWTGQTNPSAHSHTVTGQSTLLTDQKTNSVKNISFNFIIRAL